MSRLAWIFVLLVFSACEDRADYFFDYKAFPDLLALPNGELICAFYSGWEHISHGSRRQAPRNGGRVLLSRSIDLGKTWSNPTVIFDSKLDDRDASLFLDKTGILYCSFFVLDQTKDFVTTKVLLAKSYDLGRSWLPPTELRPNDIATSSPLMQLDQGIFLPVYDIAKNRPSICQVLRSTDGGVNWSDPVTVMAHPEISLSEPSLCVFQDRVFMVARADELRDNMRLIESNDGGNTWTDLIDLGFPGHAPFLYNFKDSVVLLGHRHPLTSVRIGAGRPLTFSDPIVIDHDYGSYGAYPSIAEIDRGRLMVAYYVETRDFSTAEIRFRYLSIKNENIIISGLISKIKIAD